MKTIDEIWAWVAIDPTLGENREKLVCAVEQTGTGTRTLPLVYSQRDAAERARPDAQRFADEQNVTVRLVKYSTRRNLGSVKPAPRPATPAKPPRKRRNGRCQCCERGDEYNGYGSDGPLAFICPKDCSCHD